MTLLDEVAHRQPEIAEPRCDRDDEPHMRRGQAVEGRLVLAVPPAHRKIVFLAAFEIGGFHRRPDEFAPGTGCFGHFALVSANGRPYETLYSTPRKYPAAHTLP